MLDRGVILQILQSGKTLSREEILTQSRLWYTMQGRSQPPSRDEDMLAFSVTARKVFEGMCREKVESLQRKLKATQKDNEKPVTMEPKSPIEDSQVDLVSNRMETSTEDEKPPTPEQDPSPLERVAFLIEQMEWMDMKSSIMNFGEHELTIKLSQQMDKINKSSKDFHDKLNVYFSKCLEHMSSGETSDVKTQIHDVSLIFKKNHEEVETE
jgi:hypothetical protein